MSIANCIGLSVVEYGLQSAKFEVNDLVVRRAAFIQSDKTNNLAENLNKLMRLCISYSSTLIS